MIHRENIKEYNYISLKIYLRHITNIFRFLLLLQYRCDYFHLFQYLIQIIFMTHSVTYFIAFLFQVCISLSVEAGPGRIPSEQPP